MLGDARRPGRSVTAVVRAEQQLKSEKKKTNTKKVGITDSLLNVYVIQELAALIA